MGEPKKVLHLFVDANRTVMLEPNYVNIGAIVGVTPVTGAPPEDATDTTIRDAVRTGLVRRLTVVCPQETGPAKITTVLVGAAQCPKTSGVIGKVLNGTAGTITRAYFSQKVRNGA